MTNDEYIKQLDILELAGFLFNVGDSTSTVTDCFDNCKNCTKDERYCIGKIMEWLANECE